MRCRNRIDSTRRGVSGHLAEGPCSPSNLGSVHGVAGHSALRDRKGAWENRVGW